MASTTAEVRAHPRWKQCRPSQDDARRIAAALRALPGAMAGQFHNLDIKALAGARIKNLYRLRVGAYRIVFTVGGGEVLVLALQRRDETTYSDLDRFAILRQGTGLKIVEVAPAVVAAGADGGRPRPTSAPSPRGAREPADPVRSRPAAGARSRRRHDRGGPGDAPERRARRGAGRARAAHRRRRAGRRRLERPRPLPGDLRRGAYADDRRRPDRGGRARRARRELGSRPARSPRSTSATSRRCWPARSRSGCSTCTRRRRASPAIRRPARRACAAARGPARRSPPCTGHATWSATGSPSACC